MDSARSKSMGKRPAVPTTDNRASRSSSMKEKNRITHSATIESMGSANELKNFGVNSGTTTKKLASDMVILIIYIQKLQYHFFLDGTIG